MVDCSGPGGVAWGVLRVLSLNIWHHSGPWKERRELIRSWIERLDPDVIGLQEVLRGPELDQLADLAPSGFSTDYARAIPFWGDRSLDFGNAIASRWPIETSERVELPNGATDEERVALAATIAAPFGPLLFTSTHLHWRFHHGYVREQQVAALGELVLRLRPRGGFPPVLVGDFNAEPDSTEIRYVSGLHAKDGRSLYLRDAWTHAGSGSDGITWANRNPYARIALEPDRRIDYVFVGPPRETGVGLIEACRVVCNEPEGGVWPSDHFGVYAEIRTEPLPEGGAGG